MNLKPVVVVIPQRTLRFLSASGLGSTRCPPVLVAKRRGTSAELCIPPPGRGGQEEGGRAGEEGGVAAGEDCPGDGEDVMADDESAVDEGAKEPSSRAVKHKAVEQRRKKKISDGVQQLLETLRPSSPSGKMTRVDILEKAVDKIKTLKEENEQLKSKIDSLPPPGGELELYNKLEKQMVEFIALKSQLEKCLQRQHRSPDQNAESCDLSQAPGGTPPSVVSSWITLPTSTLPESSMCSMETTSIGRNNAPPTNVRISHIRGNGSTSITTTVAEAPPTDRVAPPTNQPWPVASILSQVSNCPNRSSLVPDGCHGNDSRNSTVQSSPVSSQDSSSLLSSLSRAPPSAASSTSYTIPSRPAPSSTGANACRLSLTLGSNQQPHTSASLGNPVGPMRLREESGTVHSRFERQQLQCQRDEYLRYSSSHDFHQPPAQSMQTHASSGIVQPWIESSRRPRLRHVTRATPTHISPHHPLSYHHHHHHEESSGRGHHNLHTDRFVPYTYTSATGRINYHNTNTFSAASWSHDSHMSTRGGSNAVGAPQNRSYASAYEQPHPHNHLTLPYASNSYNYSSRYSSGQGHPSPFCRAQQASTRNGSLMSVGAMATPHYPIQPHTHVGSQNPATVWRPYSEQSRSSGGFYLSDILSLPSETETPPIQLESTPPSSHRTMHSFLVNRLLDDMQ